jgi:hypothetical protein
MVLFEWGYAYITFKRGARLITGDDAGIQAQLGPTVSESAATPASHASAGP